MPGKGRINKSEIEARRLRVADMLLRRMNQTAIAKVLGVSKPTVHRDVLAIEAEWRKQAVADLDTIKARELAELDEMERQVIKASVEQGDDPGVESPKWVEARLKIKDRRAKLLGLDSPQKIEHVEPLTVKIVKEGMMDEL